MRKSLLIGLFLFISASLFSQAFELEEVVVTATRESEEIQKIPATITVITEEEIKTSSAKNLGELLESELGIVVGDYLGNGKTINVDIRGFGETAPSNVLVLVDGMRVNAIDLSGVDWTQIPLERIERVEIVRGPGSVLYGDNAVGGVINIITRKGKGAPTFSLEGITGSYSLSKTILSVEGSTSSISYSFSTSSSSTNGYRENNYFDTRDSGGNLSLQISEALTASLYFTSHWDNYGLPGFLYEDDYEEDRRQTNSPDNYAKTRDSQITFKISAGEIDTSGKLELDITSRGRKGNSYWKDPFYIWEWKGLMNWEGINPRYTLEKEVFAYPNRFTVGADFWKQWYKGDSDMDMGVWGHTLTTLKARRENTGYYIHDQLQLGDSFLLSVGYRKEIAKYTFNYETQDIVWGSYLKTRETLKEDVEASNAGITYLFGESNSAFLKYSRSFRYPVIDEYFNYGTGKVEDLDIQKGETYEAGLRYLLSEDLKGEISLFSTRIKNEIFYDPKGGPFGWGANVNYKETFRKGAELRLLWSPASWEIELNYAYIHPVLGKGDYEGNKIPGVPENKGGLIITYNFSDNLKWTTRCNYVGERYPISDWDNEAGKLSSYSTVDTWISWKKGNWGVIAGVNNLFDEKYAEMIGYSASRDEKWYYPSPERNFYLKIGYKKTF
ncbi:MAG TPA: TonB-dependent receptor [bacterium]|nr:TonB-dependent receptor [bacterium]HEX68422.1 TonB-dependent receptor [bacterium]